MAVVIGFDNKYNHKVTCSHCNAIVSFNNSDIYHDDFGCEIICPNCKHEINF